MSSYCYKCQYKIRKRTHQSLEFFFYKILKFLWFFYPQKSILFGKKIPYQFLLVSYPYYIHTHTFFFFLLSCGGISACMPKSLLVSLAAMWAPSVAELTDELCASSMAVAHACSGELSCSFSWPLSFISLLVHVFGWAD